MKAEGRHNMAADEEKLASVRDKNLQLQREHRSGRCLWRHLRVGASCSQCSGLTHGDPPEQHVAAEAGRPGEQGQGVCV